MNRSSETSRRLAVISGTVTSWLIAVSFIVIAVPARSQQSVPQRSSAVPVDVSGFESGAHHWYDIHDEPHAIYPVRDQKRYPPSDVRSIADNILLFQKNNGGWVKNYDMLAVLTDRQKKVILASKGAHNTSFDNGATYTQVEYLAKAFAATQDPRYKKASLKGIDFILSAQYPNGGWPQFFPDTVGYARCITFNDDAMTGIMDLFRRIVAGDSSFSFLDSLRVEKIKRAFDRGISCILECQIRENGNPTAWCQQYDNVTLRPAWARTFEPPSKSSFESADIVALLMKIENPSKDIVASVQSAVSWFRRSMIRGLRVDSVPAPRAVYRYHTTSFDVVAVRDSTARPIWSRFYELGTNRPLLCDRHRKLVYSLAEVSRERRTGYKYYGFVPRDVFASYPAWQKKWAPGENVLSEF